MTTVKSIWERVRHLVPFAAYMIFYLLVFAYVESRPAYNMHLLFSQYDHLVPFCEIFVIPYIGWFFYILFGVLFFGLIEQDRTQYHLLTANLCIGMTLFLVISLIWPNGHTLRPAMMTRDNIFTRLVIMIYQADTSTNVLPSIHVFNTVAMHTAVRNSTTLKKYPWAVNLSFVTAVSIILSTMFIKQHTIIDVFVALGLNLITWSIVYRQPQLQPLPGRSRQRLNRHV